MAWKSLKDRFENKRLIVQHYVANLFNLPHVVKDSSSSVRQLLDSFNTDLEALKSFDIEINPSDILFIYLITSKLDFINRKGWQESLTTNLIRLHTGCRHLPMPRSSVLRLLSDQVEATFPKVAEIIKDNFYVDDVLYN